MKKLFIFSFILILISNIAFAQCFSTISSNTFHTAARKTDGSYWVWGAGASGMLGNTTALDEPTPIMLVNTSNWSYIKTNPLSTFAITNGGALWGTGGNSFGCLGVGSSISQFNEFQQVGNQSNWKAIDGHQDFTIALKTNGTLWSWGHNNYHQLGNGNTIDSNVPQQISTDTDWKMIESSGVSNSFAIKTNGTLWGWGSNVSYLLGDPSVFSYLATPTQIHPETDWRTITCGSGHALAIKNNGTLWSWGSYGQGQTGIDIDNLPAGGFDPSAPRQIGTDNNWQSLAAGSSVSMGIKTDGTLWVWGLNDVNQLGDGTNVYRRHVPFQIGTDTNWATINCGLRYSIAQKTDGSMWAWGDNTYGQLGNGTTDNILVPTLINVTGCTLANETFNLENKKIQLIPNPAKDYVTISYNELAVNATITLYDLTGRNLANFYNDTIKGTITVDTSNYPAGMYLVVVRENEPVISQQKLIIER